MTAAARLLKLLIRISGVGALVLGLAIWAGYLFSWLPVHIVFGATLVLEMWVTAVLAYRAGARPGFALLVFLWGLGILMFGRLQGRIMPGPTHWIIKLAHLLAGGIAMGFGVVLATAIEHATSAQTSMRQDTSG